MAKVLITEQYLTDIADAIREKKESEETYNPSEMADAIESIQTGEPATLITKSITENGTYSASSDNADGYSSVTVNVQGSGGDPQEYLHDALMGTLTSYIDDELTTVRTNVPVSLTTFICHNITSMANGSLFNGVQITALALPKLTSYTWRSGFLGLSKMTAIDLSVNAIATTYFSGDALLTTIILRRTTMVELQQVNAFTNTPFASGKAGGTIYIPKVLYDELGTGSANDYKAATNWSTVDGYGTITWAQIEGSIYETQYADGVTIPTT